MLLLEAAARLYMTKANDNTETMRERIGMLQGMLWWL